MFADIVGYTALMENDESLAMDFRERLKNKLEKVVSEHGGRLLEFHGDGALCSFTSTLESVKAATKLQLAMQAPPLVPLRIGIHTGDVLVDDNNVYGDGVNIASRMESFAVPGSIFISGKAYDDIKNQKEVSAVSMGRYLLKNVKEQMEIFAISNPGLKIPDVEVLEGKGEVVRQKCILVLPFVNMSNDAEQDYFSDGLTEELISNLSRLKETRVISRTTSMRYKNTAKDTKTIGKETGADYIMEGSVRKSGNNLRITAQFIDAPRDVHLWAQSFRGTLDDIFDIQEDVSAKIVEALRLQLSTEEKVTLQKRYTDNTEAYQLYLQGIFFWKKRNEQGLSLAIKYFEKALEKDPDYALAWAGIADTLSLMGEYTNLSRRDLYTKQMEAVHKALEIDPQLAEAHISLGISLMLNDWDWAGAEREFKLGLQLDPKNATGHHWFAELLLFLGRTEEAFKEINLAVDLDPISQGILKDKGIFQYYVGQYDEAMKTALTTLDLDPGFTPVHRLISLVYTGKGMFEEAIRENQRWGELTGNKIKTDVSLAHILASAGKKDEAKKIIEDAGIEKILSSNDYRGVALVYAALDDIDEAFEWLEKSYQKHEESLCSIGIDPKFDSLRDDPRFTSLMKKIGLLN
ncbi:MAG TPA: adenylate/guanylate cyclase domain-containing protein [Chitinophagaceae bacterium]|nr:adenylate/guanylate cyclase domain-containing protein [Chitinophagaceae bacterium]